MTRCLGVTVAVLLCEVPCSATDWPDESLPHLVGRAKVIVVGEIATAGEDHQVVVSRTLTGKSQPTMRFRCYEDFRVPLGQVRVLFLADYGKGLVLDTPFAIKPVELADKIGQVIEMQKD